MYDVNPLGHLMHLKDLDRQAVPKLRAVRSQRESSFSVTAVMIALLQRLHVAGILRPRQGRAIRYRL
jgi:hypothetical protein